MNQNNISAAELFLRVRELLILPELEPKTRNKMMHDTLILCCHEGVKETKQAFGNLFSQVDYLCKAHGIKVADKIAIQTMRRHSNSQEPLSSEDLKYDARALAIFISAVFGVDVPHELNVLIPHTNRPYQKGLEINNRRIRCIVKNWDSLKNQTCCFQIQFHNTLSAFKILKIIIFCSQHRQFSYILSSKKPFLY